MCLNVCKAGTEEYMKDGLQFPVRLLDKKNTEAVTPYGPVRAFTVFIHRFFLR